MTPLNFVAARLNLPHKELEKTIGLLSEGATIPFIARYRKEVTGNLDEVEIDNIDKLLKTYHELEKRKATILKAIEEQNALSDSLKKQIENASDLVQLEDLYLPYKKKRKTKADAARELGLEPLAKILMAQNSGKAEEAAARFVKGEVKNTYEALEGAKNIIAEWINENQVVRHKLRQLYARTAEITSKVVKSKEKTTEAQKFSQYFDWSESVKKIPSHRFLAIHRAQEEGLVRIKVDVDKQKAHQIISEIILKRNGYSSVISEAIEDAYKRLLKPSFSTEFLNEAKLKADEEAITVFASNLEQLLMAPPLGSKRILALDPGFKSGCKLVCLDENGKLLHNTNIYPHPPQNKSAEAVQTIKSLTEKYKIGAISIGNGTASRETEQLVKSISFEKDVPVFVVNEAGASVYSASKVAREEFPDDDITVRGAVSIGRRLSDPLAELVKIDPKAIGVGQYQHEVDQGKLKEKLDTVVMLCVNRIGVNINTASKELLSYVSGVGPTIASNIIDYRNKNSGIGNRKELLKIPRLGPKVFEQSAGFLRIKTGDNVLDATGVHPESYDIVKKMAQTNNLKISELAGNKEVLQKLQLSAYVSAEAGLPTLKDIVKELEKPGLDPRSEISQFEFDPSVKTFQDLREGMKLPGLVNNITNFGCFVDIGIKESGLIHISKLANAYVSDVNSVVKLNQEVMVTIISLDEERKRIQLSLID
ncbi:Tex family protein [Salegentibacter sp. F188]|uniref:Tex family protein n=1 Tax=Autumnicola patrickiae TaxID=3075591 RepID=A0ABU3E6I1_9FLAO|nr:Tex family protein [Salegentibacter sp. F188]MDT0691610.1 Tex family protein [Salegentibacter sp. F188]